MLKINKNKFLFTPTPKCSIHKCYILVWGFLAVILLGMAIFVLQKKSLAYSECDALAETEKKQCESMMDKAKTYEKIIKLKEKQETTINSQLEVINLSQQKTTKELVATSAKLKSLGEQISDLAGKIKENERQVEFQRKMLRALMQNYYEYDRQGILNIVLLEKNLSDSLRGADYIQQSGMKVNELLASIRKLKQEMESQKLELENKKNESEKAKETLEDKNLALQNTENQKEVLLGQTQKEKEKYSQLLASIEDEIYNLESGKYVNYSNLPPAKGGYFDYPVSNPRITQGYGMTSYAKSGAYGGKPHNGIDFGISFGNIYAVRDGTIVGSGDNGIYAYGKWLAIDHGDGLITLYGHFSSKSVSKGKKVKKGEKIGVSGNTGNVYPRVTKSCPKCGAHLHFSVFDKKSFGTTESKYVKGLMIPTGASINPFNKKTSYF